jgi:hypothetical protein
MRVDRIRPVGAGFLALLTLLPIRGQKQRIRYLRRHLDDRDFRASVMRRAAAF